MGKITKTETPNPNGKGKHITMTVRETIAAADTWQEGKKREEPREIPPTPGGPGVLISTARASAALHGIGKATAAELDPPGLDTLFPHDLEINRGPLTLYVPSDDLILKSFLKSGITGATLQYYHILFGEALRAGNAKVTFHARDLATMCGVQPRDDFKKRVIATLDNLQRAQLKYSGTDDKRRRGKDKSLPRISLIALFDPGGDSGEMTVIFNPLWFEYNRLINQHAYLPYPFLRKIDVTHYPDAYTLAAHLIVNDRRNAKNRERSGRISVNDAMSKLSSIDTSNRQIKDRIIDRFFRNLEAMTPAGIRWELARMGGEELTEEEKERAHSDLPFLLSLSLEYTIPDDPNEERQQSIRDHRKEALSKPPVKRKPKKTE